MFPAVVGDEATREEEEAELDLLLGLGLLPPTMAASGGAAQQERRRPYGKTGFDDEPLSFATATETAHATSPPKGRAHADAVATPLLAAAGSTTHDDFTAPMTMIYAGSVRAYAGVTMEHLQAEKILAKVAKEAHAAGIGIQQAEPQLELVAAPAHEAHMTMHWGLAHHHVNDSLKRAASLARFLDKRKRRQEQTLMAQSSPATISHHPPRREEWFPARMMDDAPLAATVSARTSASLGGMDRRPRASQDHPKRMKANHAEETDAVSTELKI